jgi:type IV secretion system protein VirB8
MKLLGNIKQIKGRLQAAPSKDILQTTKNWFNDRYEWMQVQRNILLLTLVVCTAVIGVLAAGISFIKSSRSIEPFVIEIEPKTGVPVVVDPKTIEAFSADEAVKRYYVWYYIKAREEYFYPTFNKVYRDTIRVLSSDNVYYSYRQIFSQNNPQSPVNLYGSANTKTLQLKSIIFQDAGTAQVRFRATIEGSNGATVDKLVFITFEFRNLEMNQDDRLLNPLGFTVTNYQISDDKV